MTLNDSTKKLVGLYFLKMQHLHFYWLNFGPIFFPFESCNFQYAKGEQWISTKNDPLKKERSSVFSTWMFFEVSFSEGFVTPPNFTHEVGWPTSLQHSFSSFPFSSLFFGIIWWSYSTMVNIDEQELGWFTTERWDKRFFIANYSFTPSFHLLTGYLRSLDTCLIMELSLPLPLSQRYINENWQQ